MSKEAGERGLHTNTYPNNRSSSKGRNESKKSAYTHTSERVSTAFALFSEARPPLNNPSGRFCKADHGSPNCPLFNGKLVEERWKLVKKTNCVTIV